jgi:P pilus assembly chaperone PapD
MIVFRTLKYLIPSLLGALLLSQHAAAQPTARLGFSPDRYILKVGAGGTATESLMVKNLSDQPVTIKLSVGNWDLDENNQVRILPPAEDSLDRWIVVNPMRVTIPPNSPQTIRWAILPKSQPRPGEYRAIIFVEEDVAGRPEINHATAKVRVNMRMGIPVYAQVGEAVERTSVDRLVPGADKRGVELALSNEGSFHARLRGRYGIWPIDNYPGEDEALSLLSTLTGDEAVDRGFAIETIPEVVVLPGQSRQARLDPPLAAPGQYVLKFQSAFGSADITDSMTLEVKAE